MDKSPSIKVTFNLEAVAIDDEEGNFCFRSNQGKMGEFIYHLDDASAVRANTILTAIEIAMDLGMTESVNEAFLALMKEVIQTVEESNASVTILSEGDESNG
jgi:hypothetical protein